MNNITKTWRLLVCWLFSSLVRDKLTNFALRVVTAHKCILLYHWRCKRLTPSQSAAQCICYWLLKGFHVSCLMINITGMAWKLSTSSKKCSKFGLTTAVWLVRSRCLPVKYVIVLGECSENTSWRRKKRTFYLAWNRTYIIRFQLV